MVYCYRCMDLCCGNCVQLMLFCFCEFVLFVRSQLQFVWSNLIDNNWSLSAVSLRIVCTAMSDHLFHLLCICAVDLPYLSKYLVLAGYLASHNPSTLDTQLFTKVKRRRKEGWSGDTVCVCVCVCVCVSACVSACVSLDCLYCKGGWVGR